MTRRGMNGQRGNDGDWKKKKRRKDGKAMKEIMARNRQRRKDGERRRISIEGTSIARIARKRVLN